MKFQEKNNFLDYQTDEIELKQFFLDIWREKIWVISITVFCIFLGAQFLLDQNKIYSAKAIFGFQGEKSNRLLPQQLSVLMNFSGSSSNNETITQITSKNFLREIVKELRLIEKNEFSKNFDGVTKVPLFSIQKLKELVKNIIGYKSINVFPSESNLIEFAVDKLKRDHLEISEIRSGGFQVIVHSESPEDASTIANTIVTKFLELRLKLKIAKSEKSIDYLYGKLGDAKIKMDDASNAAEVFALEQNVLSNQEFATQSRRLKEFRTSIEKIENNYAELQNYLNLINADKVKPSEYPIFIERIIDISPRINPPKRILNKNGIRDYNKEFLYLKKVLPTEISRLIETLKITKEGLTKLEKKAKNTSSEARELELLQREVNFASARYEALLKEFETQSLVEGYESALGEIYETALPPLKPSSPKPTLIFAISIIIGLFLGITFVILKLMNSNNVLRQETIMNIFNFKKVTCLSKKILNVRRLKKLLYDKERSSKFDKDLYILDSIGFKIIDNINTKKSFTITCTSFDDQHSNFFLAMSLAYFFSYQEKKVVIIDYTKNSHKSVRLFKSKKYNSNENKEIIDINSDISYMKQSIKKNKRDILAENILQDKRDITINIVDKVGINSNTLPIIQTSDNFIMISRAYKTSLTDVKRFKDAIGSSLEKCVACIFIEK